MRTRVFTALFADEHDILRATAAARMAGYPIYDVYTPYAVHGMDEAMGLRRSRLTWVCFLAGLTGLVLALSFQIWTSATDWPVNVGGKPMASVPAFIPVTFEFTVLCAALVSVAALFVRARLAPGRRASLPDRSVTDDRFALCIETRNDRFDEPTLRSFVERFGAVETRTGEVER